MLSSIPSNLQTVQEQVQQACQRAGREPGSVKLLAVSKTQPPAALRAAYDAGQRHFAENYLQDALAKVSALADLRLTWHFIGRIQSNKTRSLAEHFHWVHTVDRRRVVLRLARARQETHPSGPDLNLCLQVNIDNDPNKAGLPAEAVADLAAEIADLAGVRCRGLMTILARDGDGAKSYERMATLYGSLRETYHWDTLSMGMSADYQQAIAHGSTLVRVGTAIFGPRPVANLVPESSSNSGSSAQPE